MRADDQLSPLSIPLPTDSVLSSVYSYLKPSWLWVQAGHILSRVYNCTESQKFSTSPFLKKKFHLLKFLTTSFYKCRKISSTNISDDFFLQISKKFMYQNF